MKEYKVQAIVESTVNNFKNRKVVIWGKCKSSDIVSKALYEQHGIVTEYVIDTNDKLINGTTIRSITEIKDKSEELYVIIPLKYYKSISDKLSDYGYKANNDYTYHSHKPIVITQHQMDGSYYADIYGNKIIGDISGSKIILMGYNSTITIGQTAHIKDNVEIYVDDNVNVLIGSGLFIDQNTKWRFRPDCLVEIGDNCRFGYDGEMTCGRRAKISLGSGTAIGSRYWIVAHTRTFVNIGEDCRISSDVMMRTNDGHSIFDVSSGHNINSALDEQHNKNIIIHDHVWIGNKCSCLYNTNIGTGSIVGAHSLVKDKYPNNCIIAGTPSKVIRRDVAWSNENNNDDISSINEKYVGYTRN
ncbi:acyltransferase [Paenibacillus camerounensis]|uniref:acyltransferase n=1 Tax=Paenibacillus camerounensis TaxID=1243663 RepID=UPI0005A92F88|nr:hypothetical protein [Paenibacillus camerounensis]